MSLLSRCLFLLLVLAFPLAALADATEPTADVAGSRDLPWLKRYAGSYIVSYEKKAYDEFQLPLGPLQHADSDERRDASNNRVFDFKPVQSREGARTRLVYLVPAGRSPLEVLRNYEQEIVAAGGTKKFECKADECGGDATRSSNGGGGDQSVAMKLWPEARITDPDFSNGKCAQTSEIADQRMASFEVPNRADVVVHAFVAKDTLYCKAFNERVVVIVDTLETQAREQNMVAVSAAEMQKSLASTGRIALYGIYFDTASATIKPESKAALDEIAKLLQGDAALKLHVVGHTDNQGGLESNFDLSKRRAAAVRDALSAQYGIAATRLTANGVSYLAPVASNADDAGRAKNRRVELVPW